MMYITQHVISDEISLCLSIDNAIQRALNALAEEAQQNVQLEGVTTTVIESSVYVTVLAKPLAEQSLPASLDAIAGLLRSKSMSSNENEETAQ